MEANADSGYYQLVEAIKRLPARQFKKLLTELEKIAKQTKANKPRKKPSQNGLTQHQKLLLDGPIMSDEQYKSWKNTASPWEQWNTEKSS